MQGTYVGTCVHRGNNVRTIDAKLTKPLPPYTPLATPAQINAANKAMARLKRQIAWRQSIQELEKQAQAKKPTRDEAPQRIRTPRDINLCHRAAWGTSEDAA